MACLKKILFSLILLSTPLIAQAYQFAHFNTANSGISYDGIGVIMQDSRGFIWVGTFKGLNRYDGNNFNVYDKEDLGLESDFVHTIVEDREGNLWIGTDKGVTRYQWSTDSFIPLKQASDKGTVMHNKVTHITFDRKGDVWLLVNDQGFFHFFLDSEKLVHIPYEDLGSFGFRRLLFLEDGTCLTSRYHVNLFHAEEDLKGMKPVEPSGGNANWFKDDEIEALFELDPGIVYVASNRHGISRLNLNDNTVSCVFPLPENTVLHDAYLEENHRFWLSTTSGLWSYDLTTGISEHLVEDASDAFSLSGQNVWNTFVDNAGGLWVGTLDSGLNYHGNLQQYFERQYKGLDNVIVSGFAEDGDGNIWVSTERSGILQYNKETHTTLACRHPGLPSTLCSPCMDGRYMWIGSLQGLFKMDIQSRRIKKYGALPRSSGINDPKTYVVNNMSGDIYAGTTLGLFRYDRESDSFREINYFSGLFITSMAEDALGRYWISTFASGLYYWDPRLNQAPKHYSAADDGLLTDKISSVYVSSSGKVWIIGFSAGFTCLDPDDGSIRHFNRKTLTSLPSDVYFSVVEDKDGCLYFASDCGLVRFDPKDSNVNVYARNNGLLDTKLTNGTFRSQDGNLYFGSDNGFVRFNPESLSTARSHAKIVLTGMTIGDSKAVLPKNVDIMDVIVLNSRESSFGFDISVLGSGFSTPCRTQVLLEGVDTDWHDVAPGQSAFWFNVPSGVHMLRMRLSSSSAQWEEGHTPLIIRIRPPFWQSTAGTALIFVGFFSLFVLLLLIIRRFQQRKLAVEEAKWKKAKDEEAFQEKMNFFSHVVHEIKTPLTLITTPLGNVMQKDTLDDEARHDLSVMHDNTVYLTKLVKELLDYVRIEKKGYTLKPEDVNLVEKARALLFDYSDTMKNRNLRVNFSSDIQEVYIKADIASLDKILNNLLLNALKYAESYLSVEIRVLDGNVTTYFRNDGAQIPQEYRDKIFTPFFQYAREIKNDSSGVGIGLPLARSLARVNSGELFLSPREDVIEFVLSFPKQKHDAEMSAPADSPADEDIVDSAPRPVILLVDDNGELREYLSSKLSSLYEVISLPDAVQALKRLRGEGGDLLLTDITMPGMSGLDLCREIRSDIEISHLPIIVLSARTSVESKIQAMEAGADLYIEKPFDLDYLRSSIKNILDRRNLMKSAFGMGLETDYVMFGLPRRDEDFFQKFDSTIRENLTNPELSNEWLAEKLNMSQSTLIRKIRKMLDTSPNNYIRMVRLMVAADMLKDMHGNNISDVAYAVGFSSVAYFAKCFRERYGMTPTEYASRK